jgi:hypothetical protein
MPTVVELIPRCRVRRILRDRPAAMATRRGVERLGCPRVRRAGFLVWGRRRWGTGICRSLPRSRCSGPPATPACGWISGPLTPKPDPPGRSIDQARCFRGQWPLTSSVRQIAPTGNSAVNWLSWTIPGLLGIVLANAIPPAWGLGFAGLLALLGVLCSLITDRLRAVSAGVAGAAAVAAFGTAAPAAAPAGAHRPWRRALEGAHGGRLAASAVARGGRANGLAVRRAGGQRRPPARPHSRGRVPARSHPPFEGRIRARDGRHTPATDPLPPLTWEPPRP